ncbi:unnamed protein product [Meloidogyne enterolobii]|uniref:Uncharacterized protein n=1 Tax=Meloidogyne enterolobii TaxID=390850 RepID=A0ACB1AXS3_MELEN
MERSNAAKDAGKSIPNVSNNENGNTKQAKLLRQASATLGSGNLRDIILLPYGEDENEWIAANSLSLNIFNFLNFLVSDFFRQVSMLYGMISEHCSDETCPRMIAGEDYEYFWSDSKGAIMEPCPANVYIDYMLSWVQEELDDENVFPSQIGLDFESIRFFIPPGLLVFDPCDRKQADKLE